jgi:hypothetical protein
MSRWDLRHHEERKFSPLSVWVHRGVGEDEPAWIDGPEHSPPFPGGTPLKGYPYLIVTVLGFDLEFASGQELDHCIEILSRKNLPTSRALSRVRGASHGPNRHRLSRFPATLKLWAKRERIVSGLTSAREAIRKRGVEF